MSSILKALKKLEQEKSSRFSDSLNIGSDILRTTDSSRSFSPSVLALLLLLVFGGGAAVTYYFIKDSNAPQTISKPQQVVTAVSPPSLVTPSANKTLPAEIVVVPAHKESVAGMSGNQKQQKPVLTNKAANIPVSKPVSQAVPAISESPEEPVAEAVKASGVPTLRVNGIAFQTSGADSVAIVNGITVSSGSMVEGVTVEEVRKDRVLFQRNGEKFEILLGQANQ